MPPDTAVADAPAAATPVAAPTPPPAAPAQRAEPGGMTDNDAFSQLDSMIAEPAKGIAPAQPAPKKEDDEPAEPPEPPPAKPEPDKTKTIPPKDAKDQKFIKAATLRENYDRLKAEFKELQAKHAKIEAEVAERAKQPNGEATLKELQAKYEALQKKHEDTELRLKYKDYESTDEYQEKWNQPFVEAYNAGRQKTASLKIVEKRNEMDEVVRPARQGTIEDFDAIMGTMDDDKAADMAVDLFGQKASLVLYHREQTQAKAAARQNAINEYKKNGGEREKQSSEAQARQQAQQAELYHQTIAQAKTQYKEWFAPVENDAQGNSLLEQGEALADLAHGVLKPEDFGKLPAKTQEKIKKGEFGPADMTRLHAALRNKAMAFDRMVFRDKQKAAKIKELEARLAEYDASEPKPGQGGGRAQAPADDSMESILAGMDRLATNG